ncbi:dephospho-CoA kinase [Thalassomonas actiniarum]|uniref:Dephospho-CoA kinase n=1 Tax=Thalassomonas actiniarum TaxID=485447 RepID=A0AAF0C391_9GAMM|nr:dephospho-CoA kinase [Thalassomonas actiniarum]WDD98439.1 dephospho-CoA kinase [Thalassomonas actiniarum]
MSDYIIGLTGGIGSGKTTIANMFAELDVAIVDADIVAREVVAPGSPSLEKIAQHFGPEFIDNNGALNRALLRTRIFNQPQDKAWLNQLLHPLIRQNLLAQAKQAPGVYCLLVAPLLIENNLHSLVDRVLVVDVCEQTQLERTLRRDTSSAQEIKLIINSQASRQQRLEVADDVFLNESENLAQAQKQVADIHGKYLQMFREQT